MSCTDQTIQSGIIKLVDDNSVVRVVHPLTPDQVEQVEELITKHLTPINQPPMEVLEVLNQELKLALEKQDQNQEIATNATKLVNHYRQVAKLLHKRIAEEKDNSSVSYAKDTD